LALVIAGGTISPEILSKSIKDNINQARSHRKQFEPGWEMNVAFASGKHWLVYDRTARVLRRIQDVDPRYRGKELYSADLINEYRTTVLGELGSDDDRPELGMINQDITSEEYQRQVNRAVGFGWDNEWMGDDVLAETDRICVDLGTAAIRCRFDPTQGPSRGNYPHVNGQPVPSNQLGDLMSGYQNGMIENVQMRPIPTGKICWEPLSPFQLLPPPGIVHERNFPFDCTVTAVPLNKVRAMYPHAAEELRADGDIKSTLGIAQEDSTSGFAAAVGDTNQTRLKDHVWLFTYYERPTPQYNKGRVFVFAGNKMNLVHYDEKLPYQGPNGEYRSGIVYFHWWRVTGRFWSRSLVSSLQDAQFAMDKRRTQINELIDRSMPYVFIQKGSNAVKRSFLPFEEIQIDPGEKAPQPVQGIGPGPWMAQELEIIRMDAEHASGVKATSLGENPANVTTYSQLALIKENDAIKRQPIMFERKQGIARLIENSVYDIRTYWGREKNIILAGDEGKIESFVFNSTQIPSEFIVKVLRGTPKPRTQAAELQKIQDIAQYSLNSQQPLSVRWYFDSIQNGMPMPLPDEPSNDHYDKALLENHMMLQGYDIPPTYYDPVEIHIPLHRKAQIQCELTGDTMGFQRIEQHVQAHQAMALQNAQNLAGASGPPGMIDPNTGQPNQGVIDATHQAVQAGAEGAQTEAQAQLDAQAQMQQQQMQAQQQASQNNQGNNK